MRIRDSRIVVGVWVLFYAVGVIGHFTPRLRLLIEGTTPALLAAGAVSVATATLLSVDRSFRQRVFLWMLFVSLAGLAVEMVGVASGFPFGSYTYGTPLGLSFHDVPLVIGLSWLTVVLGGISLAQRLAAGRIASSLIVGAFALATDIVLEPAADVLGYWKWEDFAVPIENYISWFIISAFFGYLFRFTGSKIGTLLPVWYTLIQVLFFAAIVFGAPIFGAGLP